MARFAMHRLVWLILTVFVVLTFVFFAVRATGDPTLSHLPIGFTQEQHEAMKQRLGVDEPVIAQYALYIKRVVSGDFGRSHIYNEDALSLVLERLPATLKLGAAAFLFALFISLPLGILAGVRPGTPLDVAIRIFATAGQAVPNFIVALVVSWVFAVKLGWLPVSGDSDWQSFILPVLSLAWFPIAAQTRITRSAVMLAMRQDYVRTARAKGLSHYRVVVRHALKNALIPIITVVGLSWPAFVGGTIIVEVIFAWPGVGQLLLSAASGRDYGVVQATTVIFALIFVLTNTFIDASYRIIDPRIRQW